jgi:hypothetical protein
MKAFPDISLTLPDAIQGGKKGTSYSGFLTQKGGARKTISPVPCSEGFRDSQSVQQGRKTNRTSKSSQFFVPLGPIQEKMP